jgi:hypothetical protein
MVGMDGCDIRPQEFLGTTYSELPVDAAAGRREVREQAGGVEGTARAHRLRIVLNACQIAIANVLRGQYVVKPSAEVVARYRFSQVERTETYAGRPDS